MINPSINVKFLIFFFFFSPKEQQCLTLTPISSMNVLEFAGWGPSPLFSLSSST